MRKPRPFGIELLQEVTPVVAAVAIAAVATGCGPSKSSSSGGSGSTSSGSVQTMAYSMPSAQFPNGDTA